jgi:hypothetical protein
VISNQISEGKQMARSFCSFIAERELLISDS